MNFMIDTNDLWTNRSLDDLQIIIDGLEYNEEWGQTEMYGRLYEISSFGRIKSFNSNHKNGVLKNQKILLPQVTKKGYLRIQLSNNGVHKKHFIHKLVAQVFIPNPMNYIGVHHKNYNKKDNIKYNLQWMLDEDNAKDAWNNNKVPYQVGFDSSNVVLTREEVIYIHKSKLSITQLSKEMNHPQMTIYAVKSGRVFKEITKGISTIVNKRPRIDKELIKQICESNLKVSELSKLKGISKAKIHNIKYRYNGLK